MMMKRSLNYKRGLGGKLEFKSFQKVGLKDPLDIV